MLFFILAIAVVNLALGFATAVYVSRRYRELAAQLPDRSTQTMGLASAASDEESAVFVSPLAEQGSPAEPDLPARPQRERSESEASVEDFKGQVQQYHRQLSSLDHQLRSTEESPDAATIESCLNALREVNQEYLVSRDQVQETFEGLHRQQEEFKGIRDHLQAAVELQTAQIEETTNTIRSVDSQADPGEGRRQMISETAKLLNVNHNLADTLDEASVEVARRERRLGSLDEAMQKDPLTGLGTRASLEAYLVDWWQKDPHRVRPLAVGMLDVDQFTQVNERHGQNVGNEILHAIAQLLLAENRRNGTTVRFSGQKFLLLFPDADPRFASNLLERIRQTVEMTHFQHREDDVQITVSCAVTKTMSEDTSDTLYARAEATLQEAKRYGRNRTFLHEGRYPDPVVPPNFTLEAQTITI